MRLQIELGQNAQNGFTQTQRQLTLCMATATIVAGALTKSTSARRIVCNLVCQQLVNIKKPLQYAFARRAWAECTKYLHTLTTTAYFVHGHSNDCRRCTDYKHFSSPNSLQPCLTAAGKYQEATAICVCKSSLG